MMNPEIKAKWVAALRGGKYKQLREKLRDDGRFCCLGVLCDLIDPRRWMDDEYLDEDGLPTDTQEPPTDILSTAALRFDSTIDLIHMNDGMLNFSGKPQSFGQIADWIEKNL